MVRKEPKHTPPPEKFFFNVNIFDVDYVKPEEPPPPPIFSEAELEDAKNRSFADGLKQGIQDTEKKETASRERMVARALEAIAAQTAILFQAEDQRNKVFERESVALALTVFETLFPLYEQEHGFAELKNQIEGVLQKHKKSIPIVVHVSEANRQGVHDFLSKLSETEHLGQFEVIGDASLSDMACRLAWPEGGSQYDGHALAQEIRVILQQTLAGKPTKGHD